MSLCKYKNILGEPRKGVHSIRLFDISVVDVVLTFVLAWGINGLISGNSKTYYIVLIFCFVLGIALHDLFCVKTTIGKLIF
jgi:hypothetical protein